VSSSHTGMFRPRRMYAEPYEENGAPDMVDGFYFSVEGTDPNIGGSLTGFLSREQFNAVANALGTPPLPDEKRP
jgi:hypothetical protein